MKIKNTGKKMGSLRTKVIGVILVTTLTMLFVGVAFSYWVYATTMDDHYKMLAVNIGKTTAAMMDGDKIEQYIETGEIDAEYEVLLDKLFQIRNSNECKFLYIQKPIVEEGVVLYVMDADEPDNAYSFGDTEVINEEFMRAAETGEYKQGVSPEINYTESNGWLCSGYVPITNSKGEFVAQVGTDISMDAIMNDRFQFLVLLGTAMLAITLISIWISYYLMRRSLMTPLSQLTEATSDFISDKDEQKQEISKIAQLDIQTNDEMETLTLSIKKMEQDINQYIDNLQRVTAEKERIGAELNVARSIQASMLPCIFPPFPDREEFDIYAIMNPAKEVGGDFYDFFLVDESHLAVVMADVSGKGVPAALFMVIAKTLIKNYAQLVDEPAQVFVKANQQLCENNDAGMFVTAFMGILDLQTGMFSFVNAGHNPPLICHAGGDYEWLTMHRGFVLAGFETTKYVTEQVQLQKGDVFFTYTDGVTEAMNPQHELFSDPKLQMTLNQTKDMSVEETLHYVRDQVSVFANGAEQADDITMLAFKLV